MELKLLNANGQEGAGVSASDVVFGRDYNEALIHQVVVAYQANARSGNRAQKDREQVKHTTKKPWRQKGTGRARAGMSSSPLWRGGGRIFPNSPEENFSHKVNKKMHRAGLCSIFSQLAREGRISVVDELTLEAPKTKLLAEKFKAMGLDSVLVITDTVDENLYLASRNLAHVAVVEPRYADPLSLIYFKKILITKAAVAQIEELLSWIRLNLACAALVRRVSSSLSCRSHVSPCIARTRTSMRKCSRRAAPRCSPARRRSKPKCVRNWPINRARAATLLLRP